MERPLSTPYPISDFLEWDASGQLVIAPKFQRRDIWIPKAKSYLIDTVVRDMPIPPIFLRLRIDPLQRRSVREVVDGQQRLRAVLGYIKGEFPIMKVHNKEFGGKFYYDLSDSQQKRFLGYPFLVNVLQDVSDSDVLAIFARMNTYTVKLNPQELRNSEFFGEFKQTIYDIAFRHYSFWLNNDIFSNQQIARMSEVELVSVLVVTMIGGIRQTKSNDLKKSYRDCDDEFAESEKVKREFEATINEMGKIFNDRLKTSPFKRIPLFYSLFCVIYDALYGLPNSGKPRIKLTSKRIAQIAVELKDIAEIIYMKKIPRTYESFVKATRLSTADVGSRRIRHEFIWNRLFAKYA